MDTNVKIEQITLQDGRRAERHSYLDDRGNEIVEIYAEEVMPLKLERRITKEPKRETVEILQDGQVITQEVKALGIETCSESDSEFVKKEEVAKLIADGVVAAMKGLVGEQQKTVVEKVKPQKGYAQTVLEQKVEGNQSNKMWVNVGLGSLVVAQVVFFLYYVFAM